MWSAGGIGVLLRDFERHFVLNAVEFRVEESGKSERCWTKQQSSDDNFCALARTFFTTMQCNFLKFTISLLALTSTTSLRRGQSDLTAVSYLRVERSSYRTALEKALCRVISEATINKNNGRDENCESESGKKYSPWLSEEV